MRKKMPELFNARLAGNVTTATMSALKHRKGGIMNAKDAREIDRESDFEFVGVERNDEHWYEAVPDDVLRDIYAAGYKEREVGVREDDKTTEQVIDRKFEQFKEAKLRDR